MSRWPLCSCVWAAPPLPLSLAVSGHIRLSSVSSAGYSGLFASRNTRMKTVSRQRLADLVPEFGCRVLHNSGHPSHLSARAHHLDFDIAHNEVIV